jgi:hypothetical protein
MGQSYRIRTEVGVDKTINLQLDQDFEFLEILSLKIQQADVYTRYCADYGVVVGRVTANNGTGIPNAKVSVFIPVSEQDLLNQELRSIYPYTSTDDVNEDGYRYNLLPYEKSYSKHAATGTFPTRLDVLTNATAAEIYDKYFKFTVKTNDSGDYMIMGIPLGFQTIVMDVDLSDIGEFSLTPQDLIRIGRATEAQVSGGSFRTSSDLSTLPQIVNITKTVEIAPLWGEPEICQIAINRVDFDLREDANIDIQPTSVFIGSIFSNSDEYRVRKNCRPRDNTGELCSLQSGPGQILAIRQTIQQDEDGNPILEQYQLEQSGNVIDEDGTWVTELPMNLDYIVTNEFGDRILSPDPEVGIPTKARYRFKIKWQQAKGLTQQTRRADFLVPNVREYGWRTSADPYLTTLSTSSEYKQLRSSYYFGLDWSGYTNGFGDSTNQVLDSIINCEDTFFEFKFNKVYTISGLIDQYKKGNRARFIGIKEIGNNDCAATVNKFPVNEGYRNFDTLFFVFSLLVTLFQYIGSYLLILAHVIVGTIYQIINFLGRLIGIKPKTGGIPIRLPMITYPECQSCDCKPADTTTSLIDAFGNGVLTPVSSPFKYYENFTQYLYGRNYQPEEDVSIIADLYSQGMGGNIDSGDATVYKVPKSNVQREVSEDEDKMFVWSMDLPLGERINIFNQRTSYFTGINRIRVSFDNPNNVGSNHLDNTITVLSTRSYSTGQLLTTVNPGTTSDVNATYVEVTNNGEFFGITGTPVTGPQQITLRYCNENNQTLEKTTTYNLSTGTTFNRQGFPMDREYFQVVTAITVSEFLTLSNSSELHTFPNVISSKTTLRWMEHNNGVEYRERSVPTNAFAYKDFYENFGEEYVLILQRGVDPYSPLLPNKYNLGRIFGYNIDDSRFSFTINSRLNIPIQKVNPTSTVQQFNNQNNLFYNSYFFTPGSQFSAFTSSSVGYYGKLGNRVFPEPEVFPGIPTTSLFAGPVPLFGAVGLISQSTNDFHSNNISVGKYDNSEDVSGNAVIFGEVTRVKGWLSFLNPVTAILDSTNIAYNEVEYYYYSPNLYPDLLQNPLPISDKNKIIMRTDALPSSDALDGLKWSSPNVAVLQQNINFAFYEIVDPTTNSISSQYPVGADQIQPDIEDQIYAANVLESFNCENMVSLDCYTGFSNNFGISTACAKNDQVESGCYVLFTRPLFGLAKDIQKFNEWGIRYKFFYGICRGVLSQTFTNNWVNGTLFAFPIQVDTYYDRQNKPSDVRFCKDLVFFDDDTSNFYYRSSPYSLLRNKFIGKNATESSAVNQKNLLFPTTIIDLGYKDSFYDEITLDPATNAFILDGLNPTSYSDTSDIINLFVISRILNSSFLQGDAIQNLFSRNSGRSRRVDGDLVQMLSINSEEGLIKFSPEFYDTNTDNSPVGIYGTPSNPTIGIFFSSTSENLQFKDFITPGRINFRSSPTANATPYYYGIKTQIVPFYRWSLQNDSNIFGTQINNWATNEIDIVQEGYQSVDRVLNQYFKGSGIVNDLNMRGYIFNVLNDTVPNSGTEFKPKGPPINNKFLVGAPFHFYFGTIVGATALEKFKEKYGLSE